ncbi:hypothetical protein FA10DRAFT_266986 [Acaromyces ingoldii]|uniref:C2H2-type domain-containing protein n=1 Tax=Acaromyces ingoldii TaxID=215250 RepID=A0A316YMU7_9BASI|nr:hypothetical protein FA10DRAFT_266986 [Acaromyces ingoldii]PWN90531.1 hypothetical protein FA10DRAFT_266986 [Acaromyces ingoldii]
MSSKATASGGSGVGPSGRKWDLEEYAQRARERDREDRENAQENEERLRKGQKPLTHEQRNRRRREELPKPTETLKAREKDLEIEKNLNKTLMVDNVGGAGGGRKGPGFYCEVCNRTFKDSLAYLDHVNGRLHLRKLGQTTQVERSTLEQVRAKLAQLRAQHADKASDRQYDFDARLQEIADKEQREREARKDEKRKQKQRVQAEKKMENSDMEAMAAMGFGSFGSSKHR